MSKVNNGHIKSVLENYSTEEIKEIFNDIEIKIENLINASTNDFLKLNNHFKNFYDEVDKISTNSSVVFTEITNGEQEKNLKILAECTQDYEYILHTVDYQLQKCYSIIKNVAKSTNLAGLQIKNFKQNLKTLKFVITNLKIVSITSESNKNITEIDHMLEAIDQVYPCFDNNFESHSKLFNSSIQTLLSLKEKTEKANNLLINFTTATNKIHKKFQEALQTLPVLNDNTKKCSDGLSNIITNLQYQDIVKQKINHINLIHKKILDKLNDVEDIKRDEKYLVNKARLYVQISDISGLQSAQLLHANKEYQQALSNITNRFLEISELIDTISSLGHDFFERNDSYEKENISQQIKDLQINDELSKELHIIINLFELQMESLITRNDVFTQCYSHVDEFTNKLNTFYDNISAFNSKSGAKRLSEKSIRQIEVITTELTDITSKLNHIQSDNNQLMQFLQKDFQQVYAKQKMEKNLDQVNTNARNIVNNITSQFKNSYDTLITSLAQSSDVSVRIRSSINDVEYYKIFEKDIEGIIQVLNDMNNRLKIEDIDALRELKDMEGLRENYTMNSEHDIHNQYSESKGLINLDVFDDDLFANMNKKEDEDDNLELF
jgi:uncharacterized protein YoxC